LLKLEDEIGCVPLQNSKDMSVR